MANKREVPVRDVCAVVGSLQNEKSVAHFATKVGSCAFPSGGRRVVDLERTSVGTNDV